MEKWIFGKEDLEKIEFAFEQEETQDWEFFDFNIESFNELLKEYPYWEFLEKHHCCYGWQKCCWQDPYYVGVWGFTQEDIINGIKDLIQSERWIEPTKEYSKRFKISKNHDNLTIFATFRDREDIRSIDYFFFGTKNKSELS